MSIRKELPHLALLAALWGLAAARFDAVPEAVPVHWNIDLLPDRTGGRVEATLLIPVIATVIYLLMAFVPGLIDRPPGWRPTGPHEAPSARSPISARDEIARSQPAFDRMRLLLLGFLLGISVEMHLYYAEVIHTLAPALPLLIGALIVGLGLLLPGLKPNRFAGIRLPWTLSDPLVWEKTHRLGGAIFVVCGGALGVLGALSPRLGFLVGLPGLMVALIATTLYAWRISPKR